MNDQAEFECEGYSERDKRRITKVKADPEHVFFTVGRDGTVVDSLILGSKVGVFPSSTNSLEIKITSNYKGNHLFTPEFVLEMKSHQDRDVLMQFLLEKIEEISYKHSPGSPTYRRPYNESPANRLLGSRSDKTLIFNNSSSAPKSKLFSPRNGKRHGIKENLIKLQPVAPSPRNFTAYTTGNAALVGEYPQAALLQKMQLSEMSQSPGKKIDSSGSFVLYGAVKYNSPTQANNLKSKVSSDKSSSDVVNRRKIGQVVITEVDSPPNDEDFNHHPKIPGSGVLFSEVINRSGEPNGGPINVTAPNVDTLTIPQNDNIFGSMSVSPPDSPILIETHVPQAKKDDNLSRPTNQGTQSRLRPEAQQDMVRLTLESKCQQAELVTLRHDNRRMADDLAKIQVEKDKLERQLKVAEVHSNARRMSHDFKSEIENLKMQLEKGGKQSQEMEALLIESESKRIDQLQAFEKMTADLQAALDQERIKNMEMIRKKDKDFSERYSRLISDLSKERVLVKELKETATQAIDLDNLLATKNTENVELSKNLEKMSDRIHILKEQRDAAVLEEKAAKSKLGLISSEREKLLLKIKALEGIHFSDNDDNEDKTRELLKKINVLESEIDQMKAKNSSLLQQTESDRKLVDSLKEELFSQKKTEKTLKDHMRVLLKDKDELTAKVAELENVNRAIKDQQKTSDQLATKVQELEVNLDKQKEQQLIFKRERSELKSVIQHLKDEIKEAEFQREEIEAELEKANYSIEMMNDQRRARDANIEELNERICILQSKLDLANRDKKKTEYESKEHMEKLKDAMMKLSETELKVSRLVRLN